MLNLVGIVVNVLDSHQPRISVHSSLVNESRQKDKRAEKCVYERGRLIGLDNILELMDLSAPGPCRKVEILLAVRSWFYAQLSSQDCTEIMEGVRSLSSALCFFRFAVNCREQLCTNVFWTKCSDGKSTRHITRGRTPSRSPQSCQSSSSLSHLGDICLKRREIAANKRPSRIILLILNHKRSSSGSPTFGNPNSREQVMLRLARSSSPLAL